MKESERCLLIALLNALKLAGHKFESERERLLSISLSKALELAGHEFDKNSKKVVLTILGQLAKTGVLTKEEHGKITCLSRVDDWPGTIRYLQNILEKKMER